MDGIVELAATPHLIALKADVQPARFVLTEDGCTFGRASTRAIVVPRPLVSRQHAQVEWAGGRYYLRDLDSVNGTYLNGQRLHEPHPLAHHDLIGLGDATALLNFVDPDATQMSAGRLRYDARQMRFYLNNEPVELAPREFRLLLHLAQHRGQVRSREECAEAVWGPDYTPGNDATPLDRLISATRQTLRRVMPDAQIIVTRSGLGFQLSDDA
jgi:pSer/pThr/pTyr-binding forkhead associated (FHA) protein